MPLGYPALTLGYAEKVRSQFLSLRQPPSSLVAITRHEAGAGNSCEAATVGLLFTYQ